MAAKEGYAVFIGSPCVDEYYRLKDTWPPFGDKAVAEFSGNVPGGMIANAACVCAGFGIKTYQYDVMATGKSTQFLLDDLEANGVDTSRMVLKEDFKETKCIIFQKGGERTIIVVVGENDPHPLAEEEIQFLEKASVVFTSLSCLNNLDNPQELLRRLHAARVKLVFDNEASTYTPGWESRLQYTHTLFFNEFSVQTFAQGLAEEEFFAKLFAMGVSNVVLTLGADGCRVVSRTGEDFTHPIYPVTPVDTTGAGDTFNSSFTAGLMKGWSLRRCARFATAAANMAVTVQGPRGGITSQQNVEDFIQQHQ